MITPDPAQIAEELTTGERAALLSLPAHDRGGLSEEAWWAYYAIMDAGLMASDGDFHMIATPLGEAVLDHMAWAGLNEQPVRMRGNRRLTLNRNDVS